MSSMERLRELRHEAIAFHNSYVKHFSTNLSEERFNKFRLYFLNLINDELNDFFASNYQMQLVMNIMQIGLNIWTEIQNEEGAKVDIFNFFFVAACFIVVKLESPDQIKRLKNWACYHEFDINFIIWAERLILNKTSWDLYVNTPSESAEIIFNELFAEGKGFNDGKDKDKDKDKESIQELIRTWMQFSLFEYSIYKRYDQTVITFASFYIGLSQHESVSKEAFNSFVEFINKSHIVNLCEVKICSESIMDLLQVTEECKKEEYDDLALSPKFTRANSLYSLGEIFTQYEQCSLSQLEKEEEESNLGQSVSLQSTLDSIATYEFTEDKPQNNFLSRKRKASEVNW